jgi:hypothetical protein
MAAGELSVDQIRSGSLAACTLVRDRESPPAAPQPARAPVAAPERSGKAAPDVDLVLMRHPEGIGCSFGGTSYYADQSGVVHVPAEAVSHLLPHVFVVIAAASSLRPIERIFPSRLNTCRARQTSSVCAQSRGACTLVRDRDSPPAAPQAADPTPLARLWRPRSVRARPRPTWTSCRCAIPRGSAARSAASPTMPTRAGLCRCQPRPSRTFSPTASSSSPRRPHYGLSSEFFRSS